VVVADASLPSEVTVWQSLLDESRPLVIPPHTNRQVVLDLEQYVCAYPQVRLSGGSGSQLTIGWARRFTWTVRQGKKGSVTRWRDGRSSRHAAMSSWRMASAAVV
jgi:hypothetical protein